MSEAAQLLVDGVAQGSRIALVAGGFSLIYGVTKTLHLAHGAVITICAYTIWWLSGEAGFPLVLALLAAAVVAAALGMGHEALLYRRLRQRSSSGFIVVVAALGSGIVLQNVVGMMFGFGTKDIRGATIGAASEGVRFGGVVVPLTDIITVGVSITLFLALGLFLTRTRTGKKIRAVQDNPALSRVVGIGTPRVYSITFALGSLVSMPAAFFLGINSGLSTTIGFEAMLLAFVVAFAGGIGSLLGTLLAAFGIGIVQSLSLLVVDSRWQATVTFGLLLLLVTLRPQGLLGKAAV